MKFPNSFLHKVAGPTYTSTDDTLGAAGIDRNCITSYRHTCGNAGCMACAALAERAGAIYKGVCVVCGEHLTLSGDDVVTCGSCYSSMLFCYDLRDKGEHKRRLLTSVSVLNGTGRLVSTGDDVI